MASVYRQTTRPHPLAFTPIALVLVTGSQTIPLPHFRPTSTRVRRSVGIRRPAELIVTNPVNQDALPVHPSQAFPLKLKDSGLHTSLTLSASFPPIPVPAILMRGHGIYSRGYVALHSPQAVSKVRSTTRCSSTLPVYSLLFSALRFRTLVSVAMTSYQDADCRLSLSHTSPILCTPFSSTEIYGWLW